MAIKGELSVPITLGKPGDRVEDNIHKMINLGDEMEVSDNEGINKNNLYGKKPGQA
jgi:hypothetical protein